MQKIYKREVDKPLKLENKQARWSEKQKYEAVALYKLLGNLTEVSRQKQIPLDTLKKWHLQDWWKDYELDLAQGARSQLSAKLERIRDRAITVVEDRLANGDFIYNQKTGEIVRKPVNANIANKILVDSVDKTILIEKLNQDHKVGISVEKMADRLLALQETFQKMSRKTALEPQGDIIDVEVIEEQPIAIHDQREAGLQAGTSSGEEEAPREGEGESGEELGSFQIGVESGGPT